MVVFYGLSLEPKLSVVMEYCAKGTLEDVLTSEDLDEVFDWAKFFQLAKGIYLPTTLCWFVGLILLFRSCQCHQFVANRKN